MKQNKLFINQKKTTQARFADFVNKHVFEKNAGIVSVDSES